MIFSSILMAVCLLDGGFGYCPELFFLSFVVICDKIGKIKFIFCLSVSL